MLATAVVRDREIRGAFPDGIYWVTLGQQPSLLGLQIALAQQVAGEAVMIESIPDGTGKLQALLEKKSCLLVLDDVWDASHAEAFAAVGPTGRLLVTTRDQQVLTALGAETHELDVLEPLAALSLLADWADQTPPLPAEASRVARECGYLPLALALAGALVREGSAWTVVLAALEQGNRQFLDHPHRSVFKSMSASIQALPANEAARYKELAIFPEDVAVPESVIARLWSRAGLDELATTKLLLAFAARGLLRCAGAAGSRMVTYHDLQRDFLRLVSEDLSGLHARLLDAYAEALPADAGAPDAARWASLAREEAYLWDQLGYHLLQAGRAQVFDCLARSTVWLSAKIAASGVAALLAELALLVQHAPTPENRAVEKAVRLESGWLYRDPSCLESQLYNRLICDGLTPAQIGETVPGLHPPVRLVHPVRIGGDELQVFRGHSSTVDACAYSPDGAHILSASSDRTLREWDRASGRELRRFEGHASSVTACAYSPDGARILSASSDKTLREWDRASGRELRRFEGHSSIVNACAYSADGACILSASDDKTLREWDRVSGRELRRFEGHDYGVTACAYSPDGARILSGSSDKTLREWDRTSGRELHRFEGHDYGVTACAYSRDGNRILSASWDWTLREWDRTSGRELRRLEGHSSTVEACAYSPDGARILSGSSDKTLREWDRTSGRELRRFEGHSSIVPACAYSPDGARILSASYDQTLREWDSAPGRAAPPLRGPVRLRHRLRPLPRRRAHPLRFLGPDPPRVGQRRPAANSAASRATLSPSRPAPTPLMARSSSPLPTTKPSASGTEPPAASSAVSRGIPTSVTACAYSSDGARVLSGSQRQNSPRVGQGLRPRAPPLRGPLFRRHRLRLLPRRRAHPLHFLTTKPSASGTEPPAVNSTASRATLSPSPPAPTPPTARASSPLPTTAPSASGTGPPAASSTASRAIRTPLTACAYSPDGARILSASNDGTVRVWEREHVTPLHTFCGPSFRVHRSCAGSPRRR